MNEPQSLPAALSVSPKTELSITSLVLGILSVACLSIFAGIPAIITGHVARGRAKKEPGVYGGAGLALAGLIMGYISLALVVVMIPVLAALLFPALAKAEDLAKSVKCVQNMRQISLASRIWAADHDEKLPRDILTLSNELNSLNILVCPGDNSKTPAANWSGFDPERHLSYEYLTPGAKESDVQDEAVYRCPIHGNIFLGNGRVQSGPSQR